jgi:hypothetical protein
MVDERLQIEVYTWLGFSQWDWKDRETAAQGHRVEFAAIMVPAGADAGEIIVRKVFGNFLDWKGKDPLASSDEIDFDEAGIGLKDFGLLFQIFCATRAAALIGWAEEFDDCNDGTPTAFPNFDIAFGDGRAMELKNERLRDGGFRCLTRFE